MKPALHEAARDHIAAAQGMMRKHQLLTDFPNRRRLELLRNQIQTVGTTKVQQVCLELSAVTRHVFTPTEPTEICTFTSISTAVRGT